MAEGEGYMENPVSLTFEWTSSSSVHIQGTLTPLTPCLDKNSLRWYGI